MSRRSRVFECVERAIQIPNAPRCRTFVEWNKVSCAQGHSRRLPIFRDMFGNYATHGRNSRVELLNTDKGTLEKLSISATRSKRTSQITRASYSLRSINTFIRERIDDSILGEKSGIAIFKKMHTGTAESNRCVHDELVIKIGLKRGSSSDIFLDPASRSVRLGVQPRREARCSDSYRFLPRFMTSSVEEAPL